MAGVETDDNTAAGRPPAGAAAEQLCFLQCLLAHAACVLGTYVAGEVRLVTGGAAPEADRYLPPGARFACRHANEPGSLLPKHLLQGLQCRRLLCRIHVLIVCRILVFHYFLELLACMGVASCTLHASEVHLTAGDYCQHLLQSATRLFPPRWCC